MRASVYVVFNNSEGYTANDEATDTWSSCCIGALIFVLIILLVLVITL